MRFCAVNPRSLFLALFLTTAAGVASAQSSKLGTGLIGGATLVEEKQSSIVSFSPVFESGKTYVRWMVQNDEKDGLFIIERSGDGVDFQALGFKDRVGSPLCVNLFYSFIDEEPEPGVCYYRIMAVSTDQTYSYSDVVRVKTAPASPNSPENNAMDK